MKKNWKEQIGKLAIYDKKGILNIISHTKVIKVDHNFEGNSFRVVGIEYRYVIIGGPMGILAQVPKKHVKIINPKIK